MKTSIRTLKRALPLLLTLLLLAYWMLAKAVLFERLEYTSDLFDFLEMSRSFAAGRPLLYDNNYGNTPAIHNYYIVPLFYPLTAILGAYGLFAGLAGLWLLALLAIRRLAGTADPWKRELYWIVTLALVLGPVSFWLWDDAHYGWHAQSASSRFLSCSSCNSCKALAGCGSQRCSSCPPKRWVQSWLGQYTPFSR